MKYFYNCFIPLSLTARGKFFYGGKQCENSTTRDTLHPASVQRSRRCCKLSSGDLQIQWRRSKKKPDPIFYGDIKRYFGVELEIDEGGRNGDNADKLSGIGNRIAEHIYIKSDGSLSDGMEIVTHPISGRISGSARLCR